MKLIDARSIQTGYRHGFRGTVTISKHLSASIYSGEVVGLIGPNGCGKSTLLRSLSGLQSVLDGSVYIGGSNISHMSPLERARKISVVLTERVHVGHLKADTIVSLGRYQNRRLSSRLTA